jgi:hypothetical protein
MAAHPLRPRAVATALIMNEERNPKSIDAAVSGSPSFGAQRRVAGAVPGAGASNASGMPLDAQASVLPDSRTLNPLLRLPQDQREDIFIWLREGADYDAINIKLLDKDLPTATPREIDQFFRAYARERWERRVDRAAEEADALITSMRRTPGNLPEAVLAALGQEAFRQISSGKAEAAALTRYTALFLRARDQDRAERALVVQADKARHAQRTSVEKALDAFARDLPQNPAALKAFQDLKQQLLEPIDIPAEIDSQLPTQPEEEDPI